MTLTGRFPGGRFRWSPSEVERQLTPASPPGYPPGRQLTFSKVDAVFNRERDARYDPVHLVVGKDVPARSRNLRPMCRPGVRAGAGRAAVNAPNASTARPRTCSSEVDAAGRGSGPGTNGCRGSRWHRASGAPERNSSASPKRPHLSFNPHHQSANVIGVRLGRLDALRMQSITRRSMTKGQADLTTGAAAKRRGWDRRADRGRRWYATAGARQSRCCGAPAAPTTRGSSRRAQGGRRVSDPEGFQRLNL